MTLGENILIDQIPGQGTLIQKFDATDCYRRFGVMVDMGLNCVRQAIGVNEVFDPVTNEDNTNAYPHI